MSHLRPGIALSIILLLMVAGALAAELPNAAATAQDFDQDGVIDANDACPGTPPGSIIVDPMANLEYAGCTCEQVRGIVNLSNPCIDMYCFQKLLRIRDDAVERTLVDCPEDYCEGFTYIDYPKDGYEGCVGGQLKDYSCQATIIENSTACGFEKPSETSVEEAQNISFPAPEETNASAATDKGVNATIDEVSPEPDESSVEDGVVKKTYYLSHATINYSYAKTVTQGEDSLFRLQFTTKKSGVAVDPVLTTDDGTEIGLSGVNCTDVDGAYSCTGTWRLPTDRKGERSLGLRIGYTDESGTISEDLSVPLKVNEAPFTALPVAEGVVDVKDPKGEVLALAIYEQYREEPSTTIKDRDSFLLKMEEAAHYLSADKDARYDPQSNTTTITLSIQPEEGIVAENLTVIEYIPKGMAQQAQDIVFSQEPVILNDDPLVMWHIATVDERVDLSYELKGEVEATGNTVMVAGGFKNQDSPWFIIIPLLMIPLLVILLLIVPRMGRHHEE